ncbi:ribonuclease H-like domain-containing protein [Candidatus Woesearchaeota archaeon]|nr:ribonuclease H-like domain-containing protein [Candidatus Woesearchaeota archaeon]
MDHLVIDIETVPLEITDETIKEYLMDKQVSKEMRSLNPLYSKIVCIVLKGRGEIILTGDENDILGKFWNIAREYKTFITHNGYGFDIPFIVVRSAINKIKFSSIIQMNKFNMANSNHFDTLLFFNQNGVFTSTRLDVIARTLGIDVGENRFDGREVERLYREGKMDAIIKHCREDVEITEKVYLRLKNG